MARFPKIARQLHLPVQSGNDRVLKAMNRHYNRQQYLELVDYARTVMPDIVLTSDVIVGFPGETEAEFEETVTLIRQVRYDALFTFIYSPGPVPRRPACRTPATRQEKNQWFDRLCAAQNAISEEKHRAYVGKNSAGSGGRNRWGPADRPDRGWAAGPPDGETPASLAGSAR